MNNNDIAITIENLSKCYQIYDNPHDRLKQIIYPRLRRVGKKQPKQYFREFWALKNISLEIKRGQTVGIIGQNGSGKSTLLQLICSTLTPSSGNVRVDGRIAALLELGSGFNPEFTGRENVYLNAAVLGLSRKEIDERFDEIAAFADIGNFIDEPVKKYSSGMYVRLAFAVAINVDPEILIVDEALAVGDELFQRKCFARIETLKKSGTTVLFVSHSGLMITQLCDKVLHLEKGELLHYGDPYETVRRYQQLLFARIEDKNEIIQAIKNADVDAIETSDSSNVETSSFSFRYESNGGKINAFTLINAAGEVVNNITTGFIGSVKLVVDFEECFENVIFGFHIKSITGVELAGLSYPPPQILPIKVTSGQTVEITWGVNLNLTSGTYFFTYGVRSLSNEVFIDRVVDGLSIKVIPKQNSSVSGLFDISVQNQFEFKSYN